MAGLDFSKLIVEDTDPPPSRSELLRHKTPKPTPPPRDPDLPGTLRRHHLTPGQYRALRDAQGGGCGICGTRTETPLYVDHDHVCCPGSYSCGQCVRGLLCSDCNGHIGMFELWGAGLVVLTAGRSWQPAATAYLTRSGCNPGDTSRRQLLAEQHRQRKARQGKPCRCRVCRSTPGRAPAR